VFDRVLVPLDGSARAEAVLVQLRPILRRVDTEVLVVRAAWLPVSLARGDTAGLAGELKAEAGSYVDGVVARLVNEGVKARRILCEGPAAEMILEAAARENADLIAMATHGRTGLARWAMGSVAEKILRASEVPVLLMKSFTPAGAVPAKETPFRKILLPTDGSEHSMAAVPWAIGMGRLFDSEFDVVYSSPGPPSVMGSYFGTMIEPVLQEPPEVAGEVARRAAQRITEAGFRAVPLAVSGDPAAQIVDLAASRGANLVVMSSHGRTGLGRWVFGSVAEKVLRSSPVPVLVVRPPANGAM
jgi:nucleotide-binding universal stress UspA family protein